MPLFVATQKAANTGSSHVLVELWRVCASPYLLSRPRPTSKQPQQQQQQPTSAASHWLFQPTSRTQEALTQPDDDVELLKTLITKTLTGGIVCSPQTVQERLKELVIALTRDSLPLITHLGSIIFDRLVSTARCNGEQAHLLPILCHNEITLLESSVFSTLPSPLPAGSSTSSPSALDRRKTPLDRSAACWEARLRPIFSLLSALTPPPPPSLLPADTCSAAPPMPVVQSILLPCVQMLETLVKAVPLLPPPSQLPSSRRPHTKSESAESTSATSRKLSDASASGKPERPAPAATTTDAKRASLQQISLLCALASMSQNRCEASGPPETLNLFWMTPILFSPDNLARSQRACLNLLKSLASVPQPIVTAHTDTAVPSATMRKPFKRTAACATAAAQRHRQAVICYLSACLRRLDELVPARGAGVPATTPVSSRGLPASTASSSVCSGGDLLVRTLWDLAVTPEEASVIQQQETTRASEGRLHTGSAAAQPGQRQRMRRTGAGGGSRLATATTSATEPAGSTNRTNATAAEPRSILPTDLHTALTIRPFLLAKAKFLRMFFVHSFIQ
ncbi:perineurial glial growth [Sparganum proliferum]